MNKTQALDLTQSLLPKALDGYTTGITPAMYLRFSGYDPRAAGGRQTLKLELRGELAVSIQQINFRFRSELLAASNTEQVLSRTPSGLWPPLILSFSSKHKEHGQYPLEVQLHYKDAVGEPHLWICTATLLLPRANASLSEIHQVFLATQKNVRVLAEDGAIAKLSGLDQMQESRYANLDIAIYAKDAAIAQLDMTSARPYESGKFDIGLSSIAWDEELLEVAVPSFHSLTGKRLAAALPASVPVKLNAASLSAKNQPTIRLFALEEWVLGRKDLHNPVADILLHHRDVALTRRISARHACLRRNEDGELEIIDTSRYGVMVDGLILEKNQPVQLLAGMRIELCASIKGIVHLRVAQIFPHAVLLQRMVDAQVIELLYLISPELRPEELMETSIHADLTSIVFFHHQGQFWYHDTQTLQNRQLEAGIGLTSYHPRLCDYHYSYEPYQDLRQ
jgi:pSer/pThr/pTyr-binding forkhead associated (FHA) protein